MRCYQAQTASLAAGSAALVLLALLLLVQRRLQLPGGACGHGAHDRYRAHHHLGADADAAADQSTRARQCSRHGNQTSSWPAQPAPPSPCTRWLYPRT